MKSVSQTLALLLFVGLNAPVGAKRVEHKRGVHAEVAKHDAHDLVKEGTMPNKPDDIPVDWYDKTWESVQSEACKDDKTKALIEASSGLAKMRYQAVTTNPNDCSWIITVKDTSRAFTKSSGPASTWKQTIGDIHIAATSRTPASTTLAEDKDFTNWASATIRVSAGETVGDVLKTMQGITAHDHDHHFVVVGNSADTDCWQVDYTPNACHFHGQSVGAVKDGETKHYAAIIAGKR